MMILELYGFDDQDNPSKDGKKVITHRQSFPADKDDEETANMMKVFFQRNLFDGFGIPWPKEEKDIDARKWAGRDVWVNIGDSKQAKNDGGFWPEVKKFAPTKEELLANGKDGKAAAKTETAAKETRARR
jgi:hypothetical protein